MARSSPISLCLRLVGPLLPCAIALGASTAAWAQEPLHPTLFTDLNDGPGAEKDSNPVFIADGIGEAYFGATVGLGGGLYRTDGTASGTQLVADVLPAGSGSSQAGFLLPTGRFVFRGYGGPDGLSVFATEPGVSGVPGAQVLTSGSPSGPGGPVPHSLSLWNDEVWFFHNDGVHGSELWRTDGTLAGTRLAEDLYAGPASISNGFGKTVVAGDKLFFTVSAPPALYVKQTPDSPAVLLTDLGSSVFGSSGSWLIELGGQLVFADGGTLWSSDGTQVGAQVLESFSLQSTGMRFVDSDGSRAWFFASSTSQGSGLWVTDGTPSGTRFVAPVLAGSNFGGGAQVPGLAVPGGLYFAGKDSIAGTEPWWSDGTAANTVRVVDLAAGTTPSYPSEFVAHGGQVYFGAINGGPGPELWVTDGTAAGTLRLTDQATYFSTTVPAPLASTPNGLLFTGDDGGGREPWVSQGTPQTTSLLANLNPDDVSGSGNPSRLFAGLEQLYFAHTDAAFGRELWSTDGTVGGTLLAGDALPGNGSTSPQALAELPSGLLALLSDFDHGRELWRFDDSPAGATLVVDILPGQLSSSINSLVVLDDVAYFSANDGQAGESLWRSDGTAAGTSIVRSFNISDNQRVGEVAVLQDRLIFAANEWPESFELWTSDGTTAGTVLLADLAPGNDASHPEDFTRLGSVSVFTADTPLAGREPWVTDGTPAGTLPLGDLRPGANGSDPRDFQVLGDRLIFTADDSTHGRELWTTDGTPAGTGLLADLAPGSMDRNPRRLTTAGGQVFFWLDVADSFEVELWATDGTPAGTRLVRAVTTEGSAYTDDEFLVPAGSGGQVIFPASEAVHGGELWISDGTLAGTRILADSAPGPQGSYPDSPARFASRLYFSAYDGSTGRELHAIDLSAMGAWVAEPFGTGCGATISAAGSAELTEFLSIDLLASSPFSAAALYYAVSPAHVSLSPECTLHLGIPYGLFGTTTTNGNGFASIGITIPNAPVLVGLPIYFQYLASKPNGPLNGQFELSGGLEVIAGP